MIANESWVYITAQRGEDTAGMALRMARII
jgi:hypothetical protein